jgi:hypothetical protein
MHLGRRYVALFGAAVLLAITLVSAPGLLAQNSTPMTGMAGMGTPAANAGRPAHIHSGICDTLGDVVYPLTNLVAPSGATSGQASAIVAETSFTTVDASLDDLLAGTFAVNVHESVENIGNYIACGDIGGAVDAQGALVIGLRELNNSGFTGIAFLAPNASDASQTDVSVFIAQGLAGGAAAPMATPGM